MKHRSPHRRFTNITYILLCAAILVQAGRVAYRIVVPAKASAAQDYHTVLVAGNVQNPGTYRVAAGVSHFELLKVAGVRPTSDISTFNLANQVEEDQTLNVGTLAQPAALTPAKASARLEFSFGQIDISAADGRTVPTQPGIAIKEGERVQTGIESQAEVSFGNYSRVDMDKSSDITFDKFGAEEAGKKLTQIFHKSGSAWYQVVPETRDALFRVVTEPAQITVASEQAGFMIQSTPAEVRVHNIEGLLLLEGTRSEETLNLIAGQTAVLFSDGRPFQISQTTSDVNPQEQFTALNKQKSEVMANQMPFNFLFMGTADIYLLISIQFQSQTIHVIRIPGNTSVEEFAQGFLTLAQAFLHGGPVFVTTLVEQMMNTKVGDYAVFDMESAVRLISSLGGLPIAVDRKVATHLGINPGEQKLSSQQILRMMNPTIDGYEASQERQIVVLKALFENIRKENIVINSIMAEQIAGNMETSFGPADMVKHYKRFMEKKDWRFIQQKLPTTPIKKGSGLIFAPNLEQARELLTPPEERSAEPPTEQ